MSENRDEEIKITQFKRAFQSFLEASDLQVSYRDKVQAMINQLSHRLVVNLNDLRAYEEKEQTDRGIRSLIVKEIIETPALFLQGFHRALKEFAKSLVPDYGKSFNDTFFVGFEGSFGEHHVTPRGLNAEYLGTLVCVEGIVSRCTLVRPKVVTSVHYCPTTESTTSRSYRDFTSIDGPPTSSIYPSQDDKGNPLVTEFGYSVYKNNQTISIQEMPERAPTGQLPRSVDVILDDDLVDKCKPGDRVQIVGIYRALPNKFQGGTNGVFKTVIIANHLVVLNKEAMAPRISEDDVKNIRKICSNKKTSAFELVARSLAPSIYGHDEIKQGLLCLLIGGEEKNLPRGGHIRGDINVLLVGDPSCGKSQLLRFVQNTAPHCITTTGRGSSGVGLTAAVTSDPDTGERRLEAGAMVLADRGIVCIDEFDKMSDLDRVSLHEVMEQQTVTIAKAGIHTSLNARCSVLAAANPVYGQYNQYQTPMDNIGLPDSLLSRFDLLFIVLDKMDPNVDKRLAGHVLQSHIFRKPGEADGEPLRVETAANVVISEEGQDEQDENPPMYATNFHSKTSKSTDRILSVDFIRKFLYFVKLRSHPVLTKEAASFIANSYAELRDKETESKTLPVTARTLETMIRLSTAHAKCRLAKNVEKSDAEAAMDLINYAYFNEAKPLKKPGKKPAHDRVDSDDDSDHGGDWPSAPEVPEAAEPAEDAMQTAPDEPDEPAADASATADSRSRRHQARIDGAESASEPATPTKRRGDASPAPRSKRPRGAVIEDDAAPEATPTASEPAAPVTVTETQRQAFRDSLHAIFSRERVTTYELDKLVTEINKGRAALFSQAEVQVILAEMTENNQVMVTDGTVYLI